MTVNGNGYLLDVKDLGISFRTDEGLVRAVDGVSFHVERGKTLGIVGESGSGKSVSTRALMHLLPRNAQIDTQASISLRMSTGDAIEVATLKPSDKILRRIRGGEIGMIFQEPMASFSPVYTIGNQMIEAIRAHRTVSKAEAREIAVDMLTRVGITNPSARVDQYPFELSGGMRQRAMIALALSPRPALLIADEPTTALDVTIQAQILELMKELQAEFNMAIIFITHNLGVISQIADEVAVMYLGRIMERGPTREIIGNPKHPYTKRLLMAIPRHDERMARLQAIGGDIPGPFNRPKGCPFVTRCTEAIAGRCNLEVPQLTEVERGHSVSCLLYE
jgi:peptide/nickel transport system ATP-binding protein